MNVMKDSTDNLLSGTDGTKKPASPKTTSRGGKTHPKKKVQFNRTKNKPANSPTTPLMTGVKAKTEPISPNMAPIIVYETIFPRPYIICDL